MPMCVPNAGEWTTAPGFEVCQCCCVRACGVPIFDCTACRGSGLTGTVPYGVWDDCRGKPGFPAYAGDPRFDPKAAVSLRFVSPSDGSGPPVPGVGPLVVAIAAGAFFVGILIAAAQALFPR